MAKIRVRAVGTGFYLWKRQPGDVFEIPEELAKGAWWMQPAPEEKASAEVSRETDPKKFAGPGATETLPNPVAAGKPASINPGAGAAQ